MTAVNDVLRSRARLVIAGVVTLLFVAPIYLTIVNAFKTQSQILESPEALPIPPTLDNLSTALARPDGLIQLGLQNSLIDVVFSVALLIPLASAFSFYISRRKTEGTGGGARPARGRSDDPAAGHPAAHHPDPDVPRP